MFTVVARLGRRRRARSLARIAETGLIVPGTVTKISEIDPTTSGLIGPITGDFTS